MKKNLFRFLLSISLFLPVVCHAGRLPAESCKDRNTTSGTDGSTPFVSIHICGNVAWWLGAEYHPFGQTVRGIPIKDIKSNWCKANEFTNELFPKELTDGLPGADVETIEKDGGTFSVVRKFGGANKQTALVGVYETCDRKVGTFLMLLKANRNGKSRIAYLKEYDEAFFSYLMPRPKDRILFADCYGCDGASVYTWTGSMFGENIFLKGEGVCLNQDSVLYTSADEHSKPVYKTNKLENAKVISVGLRQGEYFWHLVKLDIGQTGYVLNRTFNVEPGLCE
jgi:hypothetical protein